MMPLVSLVLLLVPTLSLGPPMHHMEVRSGSVIDDITPVRACNTISHLAANEKGKGISSIISTIQKTIESSIFSFIPPPKKKTTPPPTSAKTTGHH